MSEQPSGQRNPFKDIKQGYIIAALFFIGCSIIGFVNLGGQEYRTVEVHGWEMWIKPILILSILLLVGVYIYRKKNNSRWLLSRVIMKMVAFLFISSLLSMYTIITFSGVVNGYTYSKISQEHLTSIVVLEKKWEYTVGIRHPGPYFSVKIKMNPPDSFMEEVYVDTIKYAKIQIGDTIALKYYTTFDGSICLKNDDVLLVE